jgi:hypothetical protein
MFTYMYHYTRMFMYIYVNVNGNMNMKPRSSIIKSTMFLTKTFALISKFFKLYQTIIHKYILKIGTK